MGTASAWRLNFVADVAGLASEFLNLSSPVQKAKFVRANRLRLVALRWASNLNRGLQRHPYVYIALGAMVTVPILLVCLIGNLFALRARPQIPIDAVCSSLVMVATPCGQIRSESAPLVDIYVHADRYEEALSRIEGPVSEAMGARLSKMLIGIDFDNTLVSYDEVFRVAARERGLIDNDFVGTKQEIRDRIRLLPEGELSWQQLQGYVYGRGIAGARMFEGVDAFLRRARAEGLPVVVVSHKTEYGHYDPERVNLREAARAWMQDKGFFAPSGYGIPAENVFFEHCRADKLERIASLGCTHFIDDLEEVLEDPAFPPNTARILFSQSKPSGAVAYPVCTSWDEIEGQFFERA